MKIQFLLVVLFSSSLMCAGESTRSTLFLAVAPDRPLDRKDLIKQGYAPQHVQEALDFQQLSDKEVIEKSKTALKRAETPNSRAVARLNIAAAHIKIGGLEDDSELQLYELQLIGIRNNKNLKPEVRASATRNLAVYYDKIGNPDRAEWYGQRALEIEKED